MRIVMGCILITTGVFAPFYKAQFKGEIALFDASREVGIAFLVLAAFALIMGVTNRAWRSWISGFVGLILTLVCMLQFYASLGSVQARFDRVLSNGFGRSFLSSIELSWGFWSLTAGSIMIILGATAMLRSRNVVNTYGSYSAMR